MQNLANHRGGGISMKQIINLPEHKLRRIAERIIVAAVIITFLLSITSFSAQCRDISNSVLRLHILANSDSDADQELKLKVRDAILQEGAEIFLGAGSQEDAERKILRNKTKLLETAKRVIEEEGYTYDVKLTLTDEVFPTRTYGGVTLPAGKYRAVRILIGEGAGKNWWCVMFPALCLPGATDSSLNSVLTEGEVKLVKSKKRYAIRFKSAEIVTEIKGAIEGFFGHQKSVK